MMITTSIWDKIKAPWIKDDSVTDGIEAEFVAS